MTRSLVTYTLWHIVTYFVAAFIAWDIAWVAHAGEWSVNDRMAVVGFYILWSVMGLLITAIIDDYPLS